MPNPFDRNISGHTVEEHPDGVVGAAQAFKYNGPGDAELALFEIDLVCDGNAANRTVELSFKPNANYQRLTGSIFLQTATTTVRYVGALGLTAFATAENGVIYMPLPQRLRSDQSIFYKFSAINNQAGDQFKNLKIYWLRWIDGL